MIYADIQSLEPGELVRLYELDATMLGGSVLRFHSYLTAGSIWWQGNEYTPWAIQADGFERTGDGQQASPTVSVGNIDAEGRSGVISALCIAFDDLVGSTLTRHRTLAKYLDAATWQLDTGIAQAGSNLSLTIRSGASPDDGAYNNKTVNLTAGPGSVQSRRVLSYSGSTKIATVFPAWEQNMLARSGDLTAASWVKNQSSITAYPSESAFLYTVTTASDPYVLQNISINPKGKKITWQIEAKGIGSSIGKTGVLYIYRGMPSGDITTKSFTLTGDWQTISYTKTMDSTDAALLTVRFDFPQTGITIGDQCLIRNPQVFEGDEAGYVETQATGVFLPGSSTVYEIVQDYKPEDSDPDPTQELPPEVWLVEQKTAENAEAVEFTLKSAIDFDDKQLPGRQIIASVCPWLWIGGYRGPYCGYTGSAYFDKRDNPVSDPTLDQCGGRVSSCKARFGSNPMNYGGFEASDRIT